MTRHAAANLRRATTPYRDAPRRPVQSAYATQEDAVDTQDLHATVLHLLGLDHLKTTFLNNSRSERPIVVYGKVIKEILI